MTRDLSRTRSTTASLRRLLSQPHRPDQARWPVVAVYGAVGAASFALSGGLLTVGARVMALPAAGAEG